MGGGRTGVRSNGRPTDSVATRMPSYFLPMKRLASYSSVPGMVAAVGCEQVNMDSMCIVRSVVGFFVAAARHDQLPVLHHRLRGNQCTMDR